MFGKLDKIAITIGPHQQDRLDVPSPARDLQPCNWQGDGIARRQHGAPDAVIANSLVDMELTGQKIKLSRQTGAQHVVKVLQEWR